jgi:glucose/arabinose dehydrogenase
MQSERSRTQREVMKTTFILPIFVGAALVFAALFSAFRTCASTGVPASGVPAPIASDGLALERVASGLRKPLWLTSPPGDPRLFVLEQTGAVRIIKGGRLLDRPFLDLSREVSGGDEQGLLGLAFHPRYRENGTFFVNYTDRSGDTRIERWRVGPDPDRADPSRRQLVLEIDQPYANHNGGDVVFGPDGLLYIGMGDGGSGGDPHRNGQNLGTLLGKLLRIDVDHGNPYAIPSDNPFVGRPGSRGEIWAFGLRNPWRFSFDPAEHLLYIADVGQNRWEEVDVVDARAKGLNFGWNRMEGLHCDGPSDCDTAGLVMPAIEYGHDAGCSVTGGVVYRGSRIPQLVGYYLYADYCSGWIRSFRWDHGRVSDHRQWSARPGQVTSFGVDAAGEVYILDRGGKIYRLTWAKGR